jgi:DNA helicase HerA-like ATPase
MGIVNATVKVGGVAVNSVKIGTIYSSPSENSPNTNNFLFIIDNSPESSMVRQGMFCSTISKEGLIIGSIEEIFVMNEYYTNPQMVKNFDQGYHSSISSYFPSDKWEDFLAQVKVLGVFPRVNFTKIHNNHFHSLLCRSYFPVKPGNSVQIIQGDMLNAFLGMDEHGLEIGTLEHYDSLVKLNLSRLINKHTAILAMSGAGKSYLVSVLLEELLLRSTTKQGTPGMLLFDVHGEYTYFTDHNTEENQFFAQYTTLYDAKYFQIGVPSLTAYDFAKYQPNMSSAQVRELKKILDRLKYDLQREKYDISDIINEIDQNTDINQKVKTALIGWLEDLDRLHIFSDKNHPVLRKLIQTGRLNILDLSNLISIRKKQIIIAYLLERLFGMRRKEEIPPFYIIIEEAHQFAPEQSFDKSAVSKSIIETIAREGRKFYGQICLISQRPVKLSNTVLSQCNTHIILRITNPNDLDHIKATSEALTKESTRMISSLPTGNALILGAATNFPIFIKIRKRTCKNTTDSQDLESVCLNYSKS